MWSKAPNNNGSSPSISVSFCFKCTQGGRKKPSRTGWKSHMEVFRKYSSTDSPQTWATEFVTRGGWAFLEPFGLLLLTGTFTVCYKNKLVNPVQNLLLSVQYWMFFQFSAGNRRQRERETFSSHKFSNSAVMWCSKWKVWCGNMQSEHCLMHVLINFTECEKTKNELIYKTN